MLYRAILSGSDNGQSELLEKTKYRLYESPNLTCYGLPVANADFEVMGSVAGNVR